MTGLRRSMGLVFALAALQAPLWASKLDEVSDTFNQGVELWLRGKEAEALQLFKKVLALSPSQESAYALWRETDYAVWRELLTSGGEAELVAKRLIDLARLERKARANDEAAIQKLVAEAVSNDDPLARNQAVRLLSSEHGEYAVPYLLGFLGSSMSDKDKTDRAIRGLTQMSTDVVPALCAALASEDAVQRRHVCYTLGTIADPRAAGFLALHAASDPDGSVQAAAKDALQRASFGSDAHQSFLAAGAAYHERRMRDTDYSEVVWAWSGGRLVAKPIPRAVYADEMAKACYNHALTADPASVDALAGLARSYVVQSAKLTMMEQAGQDLGAWKGMIDEGRLAVNAAGVAALDRALGWAVQQGDGAAGAALCRVMSKLCLEPTAGLSSALGSSDGAMRSEAAVALATIGARRGEAPTGAIVDLLGEAVGREVARLAVVIDADVARGQALQASLEKLGMFVTHYDSGAKALVLIRRSPGLDLVLAADKQKDITLAEILDELKGDERLAAVPVLCISANAEEATGTYGERIAGTVTSAEDLKAVQDALSAGVRGDRALADDLAARAATVLAHIGHGRQVDLSSTVVPLQSAIVNRPDAVATPALHALASIGDAAQVASILAVVADEARSEGVRVAGTDALSGILGRNGAAVGAEGAATLQAVASSGAPLSVRDGAASALGRIQMDPAQRLALLRRLQAGSSGGDKPADQAEGQ